MAEKVGWVIQKKLKVGGNRLYFTGYCLTTNPSAVYVMFSKQETDRLAEHLSKNAPEVFGDLEVVSEKTLPKLKS